MAENNVQTLGHNRENPSVYLRPMAHPVSGKLSGNE